MTKSYPVDWIAARDGIGHAERRRGTRTACGLRRTDRRLAWPVVRRCAACVAAIELAKSGAA